ncbi:MAG: PCC domain-containing protein, partial [Candidatus Kariarchaeaceae archaeon]
MEYTIEGDRIIVRIDRDEEILESLKNICSEQNIKSGQIMGIGATKRVTLRYLDQPLKTFNEHIVDEGCE